MPSMIVGSVDPPPLSDATLARPEIYTASWDPPEIFILSFLCLSFSSGSGYDRPLHNHWKVSCLRPCACAAGLRGNFVITIIVKK